MKVVLLAVLLVGAPLAFSAPAAACDGENPCDPPPMSLCTSSVTLTSDPVRWAYCKVTEL